MSSVQIDWIESESGFEMGRKDDGDHDHDHAIHLALSMGGCGCVCWWWVRWLSRCGLVDEEREGDIFRRVELNESK